MKSNASLSPTSGRVKFPVVGQQGVKCPLDQWGHRARDDLKFGEVRRGGMGLRVGNESVCTDVFLVPFVLEAAPKR